MKRNRIVINLDSPQPAKPRGGAGKVLLVIGVILILVIAGLGTGGYFWWRNFQNGPGYSLAVLVDALQRNDAAKVDGMLDTDKISADFVAQVRDKTAGSSLASSLWPSQADAATAAISGKLKETIHEQLTSELRDLTEVAKGKPLFVIALGIPYFADIQQQNNTASATVNIKNEVIKLNLQNADNRWRIVAVQDEKLAKMVADAVVKSLPTNGGNVQNEIKKQLEKLK